MAAEDGNYVTLADAKAWLAVTDSASDAIITSFIKAVEEAINAWTECNFAGPQTVTNEVHEARRQDIIVPENWPLIDVSELKLGVNTDGSGGAVMEPSVYIVDDVGIRLRSFNLPLQRAYLAITYRWGFAEVPARVALATKIGVEGYFRARGRKSVGITSKSKEGESINYGTGWNGDAGLPNECIGLLADFRRIDFGGGGGLEMATRNQ